MEERSLQLQDRIQRDLDYIEQNNERYFQLIRDLENPLRFYFLFKVIYKESPYYNGFYLGSCNISEKYPENTSDRSDPHWPFVVKMLTPNGRFKTHIFLSISIRYPNFEWTLYNMLMNFYPVMIYDFNESDGLGHIRTTNDEKKKLAKESFQFNCEKFPDIFRRFDKFVTSDLQPVNK